MTEQPLEPSDAEQAEWSETTRAYVRWLLDEISRIEGERDRQYDYNVAKIAEDEKKVDLGIEFYDIVKKKHKEHVENGFTSVHAYTAGVLGSIVIQMDKLRNESLANRTINQILDDFYDSSRKEFLNGANKVTKNDK